MAKGHKTGGRALGTPNKATVEIGAAAKQLVEDAEYLSSLRQRIAGRSPHMEALLFQYAFGRPGNAPELPERVVMSWCEPEEIRKL